jgi:uncharacterized protein YbaA (DUF1428 family)
LKKNHAASDGLRLKIAKRGANEASPPLTPALPISVEIPCRRSSCKTWQRATQSTGEPAMNYVDGYVIAVPTAKREAYRQLAQDASAVFKDHGALKVVECWGDDVPEGKVTSFPLAVQRKPDETVVFSWIVWPSRKVRDEGMKKAMEDPRMNHDPASMPFDGQRLIYGGFEVIVEA